MIKNILRGLGSAMLVMALVVLLPASLLAAGNPALPPEAGTLTIHKYAMEDVDQAGLPNDGNPLPAPPENATPLKGIEMTVWQVDISAGRPTTPQAARAKLVASSKQSKTTGADGTATFALPRGTYYVEETGSKGQEVLPDGTLAAEKSYVPADAFLVDVPMTAPDGEGWITDVHVYPKNQPLNIDKFVNGPGLEDHAFDDMRVAKSRPVAVGEVFGWTIQASFPSNIGDSDGEKYIIRDVLPAHFDYVEGTMRVFSIPLYNTSCTSANALTTTDFNLNFDAASNTLEMVLTDSGIDALHARCNANDDRLLLLKYDCKLNDTAPMGVDLSGSATVEYTRNVYTPNPGRPKAARAQVGTLAVNGNGEALISNTVAKEPSVHTGQVRVVKTDAADSKTRLAGATFGLAATEADAKAGNFIATGTTGEDGMIHFKGLKYGDPGDLSAENSCGTSYWLAETKAPNGYVKLKAPVEATFNHQQCPVTGEYLMTQLVVNNVAVKDPVPDPAKPAPQTGDSNILFIAAGVMLLGVALFIVVLRAKKKKEKADK